jgi:hypothetical protein
LLENALHHTGADAEFPADLEDALAVGLQLRHRNLAQLVLEMNNFGFVANY